jgi:hypothetical protein
MEKTKITVVKMLREEQKKRNIFLKKLPIIELEEIFINSPFSESFYRVEAEMIKVYFGADAELVNWFLTEWKPGFKIVEKNISCTFKSEAEFYQYLKKDNP